MSDWVLVAIGIFLGLLLGKALMLWIDGKL